MTSKQWKCMRCPAYPCESPKCDDSTIEVVILDPQNRREIDPIVGRYGCRYGEFHDLPQPLPAGPPPAVAALSWWHYESGHITCRRVDGSEYVDIEHEGRIWTYRCLPAHTRQSFTDGNLARTPAAFDVAILTDELSGPRAAPRGDCMRAGAGQ